MNTEMNTEKNKPDVVRTFRALRGVGLPAFAHEVPVVNMNGSPKERLIEQYMAIKHALEAANKAFAEATPHGRDYQLLPAGDAIASRAREAFHERRGLLRAMAAEIEAVAVYISDQKGHRE